MADNDEEIELSTFSPATEILPLSYTAIDRFPPNQEHAQKVPRQSSDLGRSLVHP